MHCVSCGSEVPDDAQFCKNCGEQLAGETTNGRDTNRGDDEETITASVDAVPTERAAALLTDGRFRVGAVGGMAAYVAGYLFLYAVAGATFHWSSIAVGKATYVAWIFYGFHGVPVAGSGYSRTFGGFEPVLPSLMLLVAGALAARSVESGTGLRRNVSGVIAGYLLMAVLGTIVFTSKYGGIRLLPAILFMGLGFPLVYGSTGAGLRYLRSEVDLDDSRYLRLGLRALVVTMATPVVTLALAALLVVTTIFLNLVLVPLLVIIALLVVAATGLIALFCGYRIRKRQSEAVGNGLMAVTAVVTASNLLFVVSI